MVQAVGMAMPSPEVACALGLTLVFSQASRAMTTSWAEPPAPSQCPPLSSKAEFLQPWNMGIVLIPILQMWKLRPEENLP